MLNIRRLFLISILLCLALPACANANATDKIVGQCVSDGELSGNYSQSQLSNALKNLPSDAAEYSDCADIIRRAQLADAGVGSSEKKVIGAANSTSEDPVVVPASDEEKKAIEHVQKKGGDDPIEIDGQEITPGASGFTPSTLNNRLPKPLLIVLFLIAFGIIAGALVSARAKYRSRN